MMTTTKTSFPRNFAVCEYFNSHFLSKVSKPNGIKLAKRFYMEIRVTIGTVDDYLDRNKQNLITKAGKYGGSYLILF